MYIKAALIISLVLSQAGCAMTSVRYFTASDYDRAVMLFDNGMLFEARDKARGIREEDPSYAAAAKLLSDINELSLQISRRHVALAEDYEKAGAYQAAVSEYNTALSYDPSIQYARSRAALLAEAVKEGRKLDAEQSKTASLTQKKKNRRDEREDKEDAETVAVAHYSKGRAHLDTRTYSKAIEELKLVLRYSPNYRDTQELINRAVKERDRAADEHIKKGITLFQAEELDLAIREWDYVLEIDPDNEVAADYRRRAEVILERLKNIRERQGIRRSS